MVLTKLVQRVIEIMGINPGSVTLELLCESKLWRVRQTVAPHPGACVIAARFVSSIDI